ncbi:UvrD-helicase domain-containing protein [Ruficoccus amylovorans]|uniref:DNA 3'-5' helicase n=1 Tax=Ruficoccus amylovorans TaxID=1804625 RepID=A0A842HG50_9BACT|nr:UvrD-helicase domain-containing protein [Ruficoccus amylovorans]MBC2595503.1 UvrD-helicase domain-containing protein [Ruficoccus amylovorans]
MSNAFPPLPDQADRDQFLNETEKNFSVIAPAGVGKTTSIVGRIARIGLGDANRAEPLLPHLAVVTYTNKAAEELQERARRKLLEHAAGNEHLLKLFGRAFFGTIHSFCLELLRRHGHHLGLPPALELVEDEEALWLRFLRSQDRLSELIPEPLRGDFLKIAPLGKMLELARKLPGDTFPEPGPLPSPDAAEVLSWEAKGRSAATITRSQQTLRDWLDALADPAARGLGLPEPATTAKEFVAAWSNALQPVQDWLAETGLGFASAVARRYRAFRLEAGQLTYDDMIFLADQLLAQPQALAEIRAHRWRVILDEAQDTDPVQFRVLTAVARERGAPADWPGFGEPPPGGHFCMVGDPQQSIYSDRADLKTYLALHAALSSAPDGGELTFRVTMRCDHAVVAAVNTAFPAVLDGSGGQVNLVPLEARPGVLPGHVERLTLRPEAESKRKRDRLDAEAEALARWLKARGPAELGAHGWGEVALLCPRRDGLEALAFQLERIGLPVQNHSRLDLLGDDPAFAWTAGLMQVMASPGDSFELFGVLREVFAVADGEMAALVQSARQAGQPSPLSLETRPDAVPGLCGETLALLHAARRKCIHLPLREALEHLLAVTALPARLACLPGASPERTARTLDALRVEADAAEARGGTLADFAKTLRRRYTEAPGEAPAAPDRIQLLTCHKSKGLEWPVVILPLFFSPITEANANYPQLLGGPGERPVLAVSKNHDKSTAKAALARRNAQTYERLLYVSATRARHSLIVVEDESLFDRPEGSFAGGLRVLANDGNRSWWDGLPAFAPKSELFPARHAPGETDGPETTPTSLAEDTATERTRRAQLAREHAGDFAERVLPSSLARHEGFEGHHRDERDLEAEPLFPELAAAAAAKKGADYGNWWHLTMETLPWAAGPDAWREHAEARLAHCTDRPRGQDELDRFFRSEAAQRLSAPGLLVRAEVPVFWPEDTGRVYDGTIDLAARTDTGWLVIDWKTDRLSSGGLDALALTYGPQLDCYRRALGSIFDVPVEVYLYSTRLGQWLELSPQG